MAARIGKAFHTCAVHARHAHICIYTYVFVSAYVCVFIRMCTVYIEMYIYTYAGTCVRTYIYICIYISTYVYTELGYHRPQPNLGMTFLRLGNCLGLYVLNSASQVPLRNCLQVPGLTWPFDCCKPAIRIVHLLSIGCSLGSGS